MPQGGSWSNRSRDGKMHPLFAELYLNDDSEDAADEKEKRRARSRAKVAQKQVIRRA